MKISNIHENGKQCNYSLHPLPSFNIIDIWLVLLLGLLGSSDGKESACNVGDLSSIWVGKIPWRRAWQPTPVFLPEESPWTEGLAGYSPWGSKEPDSTEQLSTAQHSLTLSIPPSLPPKSKI